VCEFKLLRRGNWRNPPACILPCTPYSVALRWCLLRGTRHERRQSPEWSPEKPSCRKRMRTCECKFPKALHQALHPQDGLC